MRARRLPATARLAVTQGCQLAVQLPPESLSRSTEDLSVLPVPKNEALVAVAGAIGGVDRCLAAEHVQSSGSPMDPNNKKDWCSRDRVFAPCRRDLWNS